MHYKVPNTKSSSAFYAHSVKGCSRAHTPRQTHVRLEYSLPSSEIFQADYPHKITFSIKNAQQRWQNRPRSPLENVAGFPVLSTRGRWELQLMADTSPLAFSGSHRSRVGRNSIGVGSKEAHDPSQTFSSKWAQTWLTVVNVSSRFLIQPKGRKATTFNNLIFYNICHLTESSCWCSGLKYD